MKIKVILLSIMSNLACVYLLLYPSRPDTDGQILPTLVVIVLHKYMYITLTYHEDIPFSGPLVSQTVYTYTCKCMVFIELKNIGNIVIMF